MHIHMHRAQQVTYTQALMYCVHRSMLVTIEAWLIDMWAWADEYTDQCGSHTHMPVGISCFQAVASLDHIVSVRQM